MNSTYIDSNITTHWLDRWHVDMESLIKQSFAKDVATIAKKEMKDKGLKAIVLGDTVYYSMALYRESEDKICIVLLATDEEHRGKGSIRRLISELKGGGKDLLLETRRFSLQHAIFERLGFVPAGKSFRKFLQDGETDILIPEGMREDPICLQLPVADAADFSNKDSLSMECYHQEKNENENAKVLLELLENSRHGFSRFVEERRPLDLLLLKDLLGTPADLKHIQVDDEDVLCFVQWSGISFLSWMGFQLTKLFVDLSNRTANDEALMKLSWIPECGSEVFKLRANSPPFSNPAQTLKAYDLLLLNDYAVDTGIVFVPVVSTEGKLVELQPQVLEQQKLGKFHIFITSLDGPPKFLFAPDYEPM